MNRLLPILPLLCAGLLASCDPITLGLGAGASVGVAATEERGVEGAADDLKIRAAINDLWFRQDAEMFRKVGLDVQEGRVLLTGTVQKPEQRVDAVRLAWQASGVREVIDEIQVADSSGISDYTKDSLIATKLRTQLMFDSDIKNVNYTVEVENGVVYLIGIAQSEAERDRVIAHARDISDVKRVVNHIILKSDSRRSGS